MAENVRTDAEVSRWIDRHDQLHDALVTEKVYEVHRSAMDARLNRIEDLIRWAFRFAVAQAFALIVALLVFLATRGPL
jgi:hypothetical protein